MQDKKSHLSVDELEITGALRVAVTGTIRGTSLVVGVFGHTTVGVHLGEVKCAVQTARQVA